MKDLLLVVFAVLYLPILAIGLGIWAWMAQRNKGGRHVNEKRPPARRSDIDDSLWNPKQREASPPGDFIWRNWPERHTVLLCSGPPPRSYGEMPQRFLATLKSPYWANKGVCKR